MIPCLRASFTANRAEREVEPNATTTTSASSTRYSSILDDVIGISFNLADLALFLGLDNGSLGGGEAVLHLVEAGHMETVVGTKGGQRRDIAEAGVVRLVLVPAEQSARSGR